MPIEAIVTPICTAEMYSLTFPSCSSASRAPRRPPRQHLPGGARRERTSAYSAITKNALTATSSAVRMSLSPFTGVSDATVAAGRDAAGPSPATAPVATRRADATSRRIFFVVHRSRRPRNGSKPSGRRRLAGGSCRATLRRARRSLAASAKSASVRPPCGVGGERQAHLVPAVDEDVRVVVGPLGQLGHAVDEGDRGGEVLELPLAHDRVPVAHPPLAGSARRCSISASLRTGHPPSCDGQPATGRPARTVACMRIVEPRPPRHRAAVRARPRREVVGGDPRVRPPARGARAAARSPATCCPAGLSAARDRRGGARAHADGEAIYELDRRGACRSSSPS